MMSACFAWRLTHPLQSFGHATLAPRTASGKFHQVGDKVLYGWSSSEVAFMSMHELTGAHAPRQLIREKLQLPIFSSRVALVTDYVREGLMSATDVRSPQSLVAVMRRENLLGAWVESVIHSNEYVLVLNGSHDAIARVGVVRSQMLTRGLHY